MGWVVNATLRPLYLQERNPVSLVQEAGWDPGTVWTGTENPTPAGVQLTDLPARDTDYVLPAAN